MSSHEDMMSIGHDECGIHHACYRVNLSGNTNAWCSLVPCTPVAVGIAVDCMFCLAGVQNMDDEEEVDPDDELDPYSPDEADR